MDLSPFVSETNLALKLIAASACTLAAWLLLSRDSSKSKQKLAPESNSDRVNISSLENKRGSEGMGLPTVLSQTTLDIIVATAPAVAPKCLEITSHFYSSVFAKLPSLLAFFNPAHNIPVSLHQPKALANSLVAYASNITDLSPLLVPGGAVAAICHRHCALGIFPESYVIVHDNLMISIGHILGSIVTPEIYKAWSNIVLFLAKVMIDTEEDLYQMAEQREGGWSGPMDFRVSEIIQVAKGIKSFSFKPLPGSPLAGKSFEFTPGQYLSLIVDIDGDGLTAPRHYTVTSPPGADFLQCTVKQIKGGKLSTHIHQHLKVGDTVKLAAPFGVFTLDEDVQSAVLMSAGIGITPMLNFKRTLGSKFRLCVHVDSTPESFAYRDFFLSAPTGKEKSNETLLEKYTRVPGEKRPSAQKLVAEVWDKLDGNGNHHFYLCGPENWMEAVSKELIGKGAKKVVCEVFGSQLATGCPFFQSS